MTHLDGQLVQLQLLPVGRRALSGLVPANGRFAALIVEEGTLGPLVWRPKKGAKRPAWPLPVMLVRWDYIATVTFDYEPEGAPRPTQIGFVQSEGSKEA